MTAALQVVASWRPPLDCLAASDGARLVGCGVCYPCVASKAAREALAAEAPTVSALVLAQPGLAHVTISDRELLRKLIENIGEERPVNPRWVHVKDATGHGSTVSAAICRVLELDPDERVGISFETCDECDKPEEWCDCDEPDEDADDGSARGEA